MKITVGITYYDNYEGLLKNISHYENFANYKFIVVDDGSQTRPLTKDDVPDHWSLYRVTEDVGWNNEGCRNLIAYVCETEWLCLIDMDYMIKQSDIDLSSFDKNCIYFFADINRRNFDGSASIRHSILFDHNQIFTTKKYFLECGGYDETYLGYYGMDGSLTSNPKFNYNISEYDMIHTKGERNERLGSTDEQRKYMLGKKKDRKLKTHLYLPKKINHNKKLTFPWIKIK